MFNRPFSFRGRIRRSEYGFSLMIYWLIYIVIVGIAESSKAFDFIAVAFIPLIWFLLAQGAKRCHDLGHSGWWQIIPFYIFWMLFEDGKNGTNHYGEIPKTIQKSQQNRVVPPSSEDNNLYPPPIPTINKTEVETSIQDEYIGSTSLTAQNVNYSSIQDIMRRLRTIERVHKLNYEYIGTTGNIIIDHKGSSQKLLEDLDTIMPNIQVLEVINGSITVNLK
nr:DUF805 domain-containing protein [Sphingobacterium wenxiniae]